MNPKQIAAERAVFYVQDGMAVGLGTRSTAAYAIHALGRRFQAEALTLRCVATSRESERTGPELRPAVRRVLTTFPILI